MTRKSDLLRNQPVCSVFGYELDRVTLTPVHRAVARVPGKDYGADPLEDGTYRMVPSGDIVDLEERTRCLRYMH